MNLSNSIKALVLVFFSVVITSCDNDDSGPKGQFANGVFVLNEGAFGSGNGTISHYSSSGVVTQDLFGTVNNGKALGDVVQSMTIEDNTGYIIVNNDNKIEVVDAYTFTSQATIKDLALPRYMVIDDDRDLGYITEWVSFTDPGRVRVINLKDNSLTTSITTESGAENLLLEDDLLYVSNNFTNTVSVIDTKTNAVIKTIEVAWAPGQLLEDAQDRIWVVCGGSWGGNDGALVQIDPSKSDEPDAESVVKTIELSMNISSKAVISNDGNDIFYFAGKSVYKVSSAATSAPASPFITESNAVNFYGIGIDPKSGVLYMGDDKGFTGSGVVYRYNADGTAIDNFTAGIGPNGFAFYE